MKNPVLVALAFVVTALGGCQSSNTASGGAAVAPSPESGNHPGHVVVNTMCPIMTNDAVDETLNVDYKGKKIGFCCKKCVRIFNSLDEAGKDKILATAMTYAK